MSADIGPGDWVEHIGGPTVPATYFLRRVESIEPDDGVPCRHCGSMTAGLRLSGKPSLACINAWRPVYRPRADIIESLKQPAPKVSA